MTKQEALEAAMTPCPNKMKSIQIGRLFIGVNRAFDYWLFRGKTALDRHHFSIVTCTSDDDVYLRIIAGKSIVWIAILPKEQP